MIATRFTEEEIKALEGRELDFVIAEAVFEQQWWTCTSDNTASLIPPELTEEASLWPDMVLGKAEGARIYCPLVPTYATWNGMGLVVCEMKALGWNFGSGWRDYQHEAFASFSRYQRDQGGVIRKGWARAMGCPTYAELPTATARAALYVLQPWDDESWREEGSNE